MLPRLRLRRSLYGETLFPGTTFSSACRQTMSNGPNPLCRSLGSLLPLLSLLRAGHKTLQNIDCRFCRRRGAAIHQPTLPFDRTFGLAIHVSDGRPPTGDVGGSIRRTHAASSRIARALRAFSGASRPAQPFK
jgi:hypothetical protein